MRKVLFLFLLGVGASCSDDSDKVKPIVCTFTFNGNTYEATSAQCMNYGSYSKEMQIRKGNDFELVISQWVGTENGDISLEFDHTINHRYVKYLTTVVRNNNGFKVDVDLEKYNTTGVSAGRLVCDCQCAEGTFY